MTENARSLEIDHLAELADLPLSDEEADRLEDACEEVLDAFALPDVEPAEDDREPERLFDDEPEPCPPEETEAILEQVPRRDGRQIRG